MSEAIASKAERLAAYNANIAAAEKDPSLSPETGKPLSKMNAARFGAGFLLFGGFGCRFRQRKRAAHSRFAEWRWPEIRFAGKSWRQYRHSAQPHSAPASQKIQSARH